MHTAHDLIKNINDMFKRASTSSKGIKCVFEYFTNVINTISNRNTHLKNAVLNDSIDDKNRLTKIEFHPFYLVEAKSLTTPGTTQFVMSRRHCFGEIPYYIIPTELHLRRGSIMSNNVPNSTEYRAMWASATTLRAKILSNAAVGRTTIIMELVKYVHSLMDLAFPHALHKDMFIDSTHFILMSIVIPFLSLGTLYPKDLSQFYDEGFADQAIDEDILKHFERKDSYLEITTQAEPTQMHNLTTGANLTILFSNVYMISKSLDEIAECLRLSTLVSLALRTTPLALKNIIRKQHPIGFAVDFMRMEEIYAPEMIYTKPHSMSMIISPNITVESENQDRSTTYKMASNIQTVSNMISGSSVRVQGVVPNPRADDLACGKTPGDPRISTDYLDVAGVPDFTRFVNDKNLRFQTTDCVVSDLTLDTTQKNCILNSFDKHTREVAVEESFLSDTTSEFPTDHAYVPLIRPVRRPTNEPIPYTGIPRYEAANMFQEHFSDKQDQYIETFNRFYLSTTPTYNPYISNFGGIYNQRFTHTSHKGFLEVTPQTLNKKGYHKIPRRNMTSMALQEALDLNEAHLSTFTEPQMTAFNNMLARQQQLMGLSSGKIKMQYPDFACPSQSTSSSLLGPQHILARFGYSVPFTHYTSEEIMQVTRNLNTECYVDREFPAQHAIISPYQIK